MSVAVQTLGRAQHQQPCLLDLDAGAGDGLLRGIVVDHRPAEGPPFGGPRHHQFDQDLAAPDGTHAVMQPRRPQPHLCRRKALAFFAQQVPGRHTHILEVEFGDGRDTVLPAEET